MDLGDRILLIVISALLSALLTLVISWLISLHRRQEKQEDNLSTLQQNLPIEYVRREDFVRWSVKIDKKLDDVFKLLRDRVRKGISDES